MKTKTEYKQVFFYAAADFRSKENHLFFSVHPKTQHNISYIYAYSDTTHNTKDATGES